MLPLEPDNNGLDPATQQIANDKQEVIDVQIVERMNTLWDEVKLDPALVFPNSPKVEADGQYSMHNIFLTGATGTPHLVLLTIIALTSPFVFW